MYLKLIRDHHRCISVSIWSCYFTTMKKSGTLFPESWLCSTSVTTDYHDRQWDLENGKSAMPIINFHYRGHINSSLEFHSIYRDLMEGFNWSPSRLSISRAVTQNQSQCIFTPINQIEKRIFTKITISDFATFHFSHVF